MGATNNISLNLTLSGLSQVEGGIKRLTSGLNSVKNVALAGVAGLGVSSLMSFAKESLTAAAAQYALSQKIGVSVEETSKFTYATKLSEGQMTKTLGKLAQWMAAHGHGNDSITEFLTELSAKFQAMPDGAAKSALALEYFGKSGQELIPFLNKGPTQIKALMDRAEQLGIVTTETAMRSKEFKNALYDLNYAKSQLSMELASVFAPALTSVAKCLTEVTANLRQFVAASPAAQETIKALAAAATGLSVAFAAGRLGALSGMAAKFALISKAALAFGVAIAGWKIGEAIGQIQILGGTIHDRLAKEILRAALAWETFRNKLGVDNKQAIADLQEAIADFDRPQGKESGAGAITAATGLTSKQEMEDKRKLLALEMEENKLIAEKAQLELNGENLLKSKEASLDAQEEAIENKRKISREAFTKSLIDRDEWRQLELEDEKALLDIDKERYKLALASDQKTLAVFTNKAKESQAYAQRNASLVSADPNYTSWEKRKLEIAGYQNALDSVNTDLKRLKALEAEAAINNPDQLAEFEKARTEMLAAHESLRQSIGSLENLGDPNSYIDQMRAAVISLRDEWGTTAQMIATGFKSVIQTAVDSVADSITGLIKGTKTWGQALQSIGTSIIDGIISSFAKMVSEWIMSHLIMKGVLLAFSAFGLSLKATEAAKETSIEASKTPVLALNAGFASASSWGASSIVGLALLVAAIAAITAYAAGAFAEGGYTGPGGKYDVAGIVHKGEFVFSQAAVNRIGLGTLDAMHSGETAVPDVEQSKFNIAVFDDRSRMRDWIQNEGSATIISVVGKNKHRFS